MAAEQIEISTIRLAKRLGIFRDYATVLLVGNNCTCKSYGCGHLICQQCVKGYVEGKISLGDINMVCLLEKCGVMMCKTVFLNDVSPEFRKCFNRNLLTSYKTSQPHRSLIPCGYEAILSNKWILLFGLLFVGFLYRGTCKFEFTFQM